MGLPSRADYFNIGARDALARAAARPLSQRISREAIYTEGTDINIILASSAAMADEVTRHNAARCAALYLDSAEGEELDRRVYDQFGTSVVRKQASAAVVPLTFSRPNPAGGAVALAIGWKVRTARGTEFVTTQAVAIPAGSTAPVTVSAQAVTTGTSGNVAIGTLVQNVQAAPDPDLTVTNLEPAAGGADVESDASFRDRARLFWLAARRGTLPAIEFGARAVNGIHRATVVEVVDSAGDPIGVVQAYVADTNGQANQALINSVVAGLYDYRGGGVIVDVYGSTPRFEAIQYRLRFKTGVNTAAAFEEVRFLTVVAVNALAPGETLPVSLLMEVARRVPGVIVLEDAVVLPVGDIVPAAGEIIKTTADLISVV